MKLSLLIILAFLLSNCNQENGIKNQPNSKVEIIYQYTNINFDSSVEVVQFNGNGERHGYRKIYDNNGKLLQLSEYIRDTLNGFTVSFLNSKPIEFGFFRNHLVEGDFFDFSNNGKYIYELNYRNDKIMDTSSVWILK